MKAIVRDHYGSADALRFDEVETPTPEDDEVLVRVLAASVNTADLDHLKGRPIASRIGSGLFEPKVRVLGLDVAGRVEAIGSNVTRFQPGDEVWADLFPAGFGAFGEYVCAREKAFLPKPPGLGLEDAATLPHSGVLAVQGLTKRGAITPGSKVLINGGGGCVGPLAIQIAKSFGAEVTGVDNTEKLDLMRSVGADHVVDYTREDITKSGRRYDLILDIAANRSFLVFRRLLEDGGVYAHVARSLSGFFSAALLGGLVSLASSKKMGVFNWVPNKPEDMDFLAELVTSGRLTPVIDRSCELSEVPEAIRDLEAGRVRGKILVRP